MEFGGPNAAKAWGAILAGEDDTHVMAYRPYDDELPRMAGSSIGESKHYDEQYLPSLYVLARAATMPDPRPVISSRGIRTKVQGGSELEIAGMSPARRAPMPYDVIRDAMYMAPSLRRRVAVDLGLEVWT